MPSLPCNCLIPPGAITSPALAYANPAGLNHSQPQRSIIKQETSEQWNYRC
jgi:hypothetical protein